MKKIGQTKGIVTANAHVYRKKMAGTFKNEDTWL